MRKALVALAVVALAVSAGCTGSPAPNQEALARDADYDWTTDANVTVTVNGSEYQAVADVSGQESVTLSSTSAFSGQRPLDVSAVAFRHPNGTVVGADAIPVSASNTRTVVELPASNGTFAFTAGASSRSVTIPAAFDGSYEVALPEGMRVAFPVFGDASPGGYEKRVVGERVHLRWESVSGGAVNAEFYLQRDLYIFGGVVGVLAVLAVLGVVYFRLQIRQLERSREQADFDLERE